MKNRTIAVVGILALGALAVVGASRLLGEEDGGRAAREKQALAVLAKVKVSLADAATIAEKKTGGRAVRALFEADDDELVYEVIVALTKDSKLSFRELEVDAVTGKVLEDESIRGPKLDDDDDDDDEDDEHEDGDDEHEDD